MGLGGPGARPRQREEAQALAVGLAPAGVGEAEASDEAQRTFIARLDHGDEMRERQRVEGVGDECARGFERIALAPGGAAETVAELDVVIAGQRDQADPAKERLWCFARKDAPDSKALPEILMDPLDELLPMRG